MLREEDLVLDDSYFEVRVRLVAFELALDRVVSELLEDCCRISAARTALCGSR